MDSATVSDLSIRIVECWPNASGGTTELCVIKPAGKPALYGVRNAYNPNGYMRAIQGDRDSRVTAWLPTRAAAIADARYFGIMDFNPSRPLAVVLSSGG